jgi:hypothetical protein
VGSNPAAPTRHHARTAGPPGRSFVWANGCVIVRTRSRREPRRATAVKIEGVGGQIDADVDLDALPELTSPIGESAS